MSQSHPLLGSPCSIGDPTVAPTTTPIISPSQIRTYSHPPSIASKVVIVSVTVPSPIVSQSSLPASQKQPSMNAHTKSHDTIATGIAHQLQPAVATPTYTHIPNWIRSNKAIAVLSFIIISGCGTTKPPPKIDPVAEVSRPVVVEVPVREKCAVELPTEPAWVLSGVESGGLFDFYRRALAELEQRRQYEVELRAAAAKCQ